MVYEKKRKNEKKKYPFLREAGLEITWLVWGFEALDLEIKEMVCIESEFLAFSKFVIELEQNVGKRWELLIVMGRG